MSLFSFLIFSSPIVATRKKENGKERRREKSRNVGEREDEEEVQKMN